MSLYTTSEDKLVKTFLEGNFVKSLKIKKLKLKKCTNPLAQKFCF